MKRKNFRLRFGALLMAALMAIPAPVMAAEKDTTCSNAENTSIDHLEDRVYSVADEKMVTDGYSRASIGKGLLYVSTEEGKMPVGYAETRTYSGTVYCMYAQTQLIDDDSICFETGIQRAYSVSSVTSGKLESFTEKCEFIGVHGLQDTSSSNWQTCKTYKQVS